MSLVEGEAKRPEPDILKAGKLRRFSAGNQHSRSIEISWKAKRMAGKYIRESLDRLVKAMRNEDDRIAVPAAGMILDRALGRPAAAVEDAAIAGQIAAAIQVLTGIARSPGMIDVTPECDKDAT